MLVSAYIESDIQSRHRKIGEEKMNSNYIIVAHSETSLRKIEEYFTKYPLKSSKNLDYKD